MTSPPFNYFTRVDLVVQTYDAGSITSKTYKFVNKTILGESDPSTYWPILEENPEISYIAGDPLPDVSIGSFSIRNTIGSFGANRKFSDVLERYSPIEQTVTFYIGSGDTTDNVVDTWTLAGTGKCVSWESSEQDGTLTFNVDANRLKEKFLNIEVSRSISGMEAAPENSQGRALPLIFGSSATDLGVLPVRISADDLDSGTWAYATEYEGHLTQDNAVTVYTKDYYDSWAPISFDTADYPDYTGGSVGGTIALNSYAAQALSVELTENILVPRIVFRGRAQGSGGRVSSAILTGFILRVDVNTLAVLEEVARGSTYLSYYDTLNNNLANTNFEIKISLDKPAFLEKNDDFLFAFGWSVTDWTTGELVMLRGTGSGVAFIRNASDANSANGFEWKFDSGYGTPPFIKLEYYSMSVSNQVSTANRNGLTYSSVTIEPSGSPDTGQLDPPLDNLPILIQPLEGLRDFTTNLCEAPHLIADRFAYEWNGSTFDDPELWDTTRYSSAYTALYDSAEARGRTILGVIDERITYNELLTQLCKTSASRVGLLASGKLFMYPWGENQTEAVTIRPEDIIALSWTQNGVETIVNEVSLTMGDNPYYDGRRNLSAQKAGRATSGYSYSSDFNSETSDVVSTLTQKSRALYGYKPLADGIHTLIPYSTTGNYLDATGAEQGSILAEYHIAKSSLPYLYCSMILPWHRYSTLEMFDVVKFASPSFPAYFGTDPEVRNPIATSVDVTETTITNGFEMIQAQSYRGLIEAKVIKAPKDHAPAIQIIVFVLQNYPIDPT